MATVDGVYREFKLLTARTPGKSDPIDAKLRRRSRPLTVLLRGRVACVQEPARRGGRRS